MGLGLHGGGLEGAKFLAKRGARVTVTDLRGADILAPSIKALDAYIAEQNAHPVRYVLGKHEQKDFETADLVLKNPGVRPDSPFLRAASRVESDITLFLRENPARLTAITGSKGKSYTSSAIFFGLDAWHKAEKCGKARLGGNITVSPLTFLEELRPEDDVVLELSSWQLADLFFTGPAGQTERLLFKPRVAVITAIMPDHLDRYGSMDAYVADKRLIYKNQDGNDATIALDDDWGRLFLSETKARGIVCSASNYDRLFGEKTLAAGAHQKTALLEAALALVELGVDSAFAAKTLARFPGIEHRLEMFLEKDGVRYYNDTAATIPEAAAACIATLGNPILVAGGADKKLDFTPLAAAAAGAKKIILLDGTASGKLTALLDAAGLAYHGPFNKLEDAVSLAVNSASAGDSVALSPGCASFGMFQNEFDRGLKWKNAVRKALTIGQGIP
jgi:UDP-N-acetylmuramoylalanine--D-glutamate ligase